MVSCRQKFAIVYLTLTDVKNRILIVTSTHTYIWLYFIPCIISINPYSHWYIMPAFFHQTILGAIKTFEIWRLHDGLHLWICILHQECARTCCDSLSFRDKKHVACVGRLSHTCVIKPDITGRRQAISNIRTNAAILWIWLLGTKFSETLIAI